MASTSLSAGPEGVILLHGLCRTRASLGRMETVLAGEGYCVVNRGYPSRTAVIEQLAEMAVGGALSDPALAGCCRVHFVTHSLGGILVRSYYRKHEPGRLGRVVMLGPPNGGSEVVDRLRGWRLFQRLNGPAGGELGTGPDSVPNRLGAVTFETGVIAGDRSVNWINSRMIPGPNDGKVSVERCRVAGMRDFLVVHAAHPFLMRNRVVIAATLQFLRTGSFSRS